MSYEYLKQENVIPVVLCKQVGRIEEPVVELSPEDEERALRLRRESVIIDFHNHLRVLPANVEKDYPTSIRLGGLSPVMTASNHRGLLPVFMV